VISLVASITTPTTKNCDVGDNTIDDNNFFADSKSASWNRKRKLKGLLSGSVGNLTENSTRKKIVRGPLLIFVTLNSGGSFFSYDEVGTSRDELGTI